MFGTCAGISPNDTVPNLPNVRFTDLESSDYPNCTSGSYIRPNVGGALVPWAYSILILIIHIPTVVIRFMRWETSQSWTILFTLFTVFIFIQAYQSTGLTADTVFVWTPVTLVIDAGSMLHLCVLILEGEGRKLPFLRRLIKRDRENFPPEQWRNPFIFGLRESPHDVESDDRHTESAKKPDGQGEVLDREKGSEMTSLTEVHAFNRPLSIATEANDSRHPYLTLIVLITAFLLFLIVLALQISGLRAAVSAQNPGNPPSVSWCAPIFQPYGAAILDGNCNVHPIIQNGHKGVGCIALKGSQQESWLKWTIVGVATSLVVEVIDLLTLVLLNSKYKIWTGVKMKRPWMTMIMGLVVLLLVLIFGYQYAANLPEGITERVMVVISEKNGPFMCVGMISAAGLRGEIIAWTDGVFSAWGVDYFGKVGVSR